MLPRKAHSTPDHAVSRDRTILIAVLPAAVLVLSTILVAATGVGERVREWLWPPARVLLAIDLSESMGCPKDSKDCPTDKLPLGPFDETRIAAAGPWSGPAIDALDQPKDRLALWVFATPSRGHPRLPLEEIVSFESTQGADPQSVKDAIAARLRKFKEFAHRFKGSKVLSGGTPLYDMIGRGVRELQTSLPGEINTVVVLTDGGDTTSTTGLTNLLSRNKPMKPVRVLITAASDGVCGDAELVRILERFDGDCFLATSDEARECARTNILEVLRESQPEEPRPLAQKRRGRVC